MTLGKLKITVWHPHGWRDAAQLAIAAVVGFFAGQLIVTGGLKDAVVGLLIGSLCALLVDVIGEPPK